MDPLVSILIPCYNAEQWIAQAIKSAEAQTWPQKEIIVIDDGSTDHSLDIIRQFDGRIRWKTTPNRGGNTARNHLLELARGDWLQYLDADDWLMSSKIADQLDFLANNPEVDVIYSPVSVQFWSSENSMVVDNAIPCDPRDDIWVLLLRWRIPQTGGLLWRRQALVDVGGWNPNQPCCQDYELYLRLLMSGKRYDYCPSAQAVHRIWGDETVSRRNPLLLQEHRLEVLRQAEEFLRRGHELTERRLQALNQTRFEIARIEWVARRDAAIQIIQNIKKSQPDFMPSASAAPGVYRLIYRLLGFDIAERIARFRRLTRAFAGA